MRTILGSLACLLLIVGCGPTQDMRWHRLMLAGEQANQERRPPEAEEAWRNALAEVEQSGAADWRAARTLQRLARFYKAQHRDAEAEDAFRRAVAIREKISPRGELTARSLTDLGHLYHAQGRYGEAALLYERALPIAEARFGPTHHNVEVILALLAAVYVKEGKYEVADRLYQRLLASGASLTRQDLESLASLYEAQGRYAEAEPLRRRLLESVEKTGPPKLIAERLLSYAALVRRMGRSAEAVEMETRALAIFPALPFAATAPPDIKFDKVQFLAVTPPLVRRIGGGFVEFEMTVTVRYTLHSVERAALQLSAVRFQAAGCSGAWTLLAGPLLPLARGEGSKTTPVRWFAGPLPPGSTGEVQGFVTIRTSLWSDQASQPTRGIPVFVQSGDQCYPFQAPDRVPGTTP